jgi:hypothetical protein
MVKGRAFQAQRRPETLLAIPKQNSTEVATGCASGAANQVRNVEGIDRVQTLR